MFKYSISGGPGATGYVCVLWYVSVLNLINYQFFLIFRRRVLCCLLTLIVLFYFFPLIKAAVNIVLLKIQGGGGEELYPRRKSSYPLMFWPCISTIYRKCDYYYSLGHMPYNLS